MSDAQQKSIKSFLIAENNCSTSAQEDVLDIIFDFAKNQIEQCLGEPIGNQSNEILGDAFDYLIAENNCSDEAKGFTKLALENLPDVDFEEERINGIKLDPNLPTCMVNMILKFMLDNPALDNPGQTNTDLIDEVFDALSKGLPVNMDREFITTYKIDAIPQNGDTDIVYDPVNEKYNATITISQNLTNNGTKLATLKTIFHESIHAYLSYLRKKYPSSFGAGIPNNEYSTLIDAYKNYSNIATAQHIYMAHLINDFTANLGNFASQNYGYPSPSTNANILSHYEAVSWSGIAILRDPNGILPCIENPVFVLNYPNAQDRQDIIKIFETENVTGNHLGVSPLINNNCN